MTWASALARANRVTVGRFSVEMTRADGTTFRGVPDTGHKGYDPDGMGLGLRLSGADPQFTCQSADVADLVQGEAVMLGETRYYVRDVQPDGEGVTKVTLRQ